MPKDRVNIYTIAKEAGVSPATVSRVMTSNANVSKEKRDKVEAVINKYRYTPNALAKGLSTAKTHTIGILIADISSPFYTTLAAECERVANSKGYILMILSSMSDPELEKKQLMKLYEQQVDAILIVGGNIDHVAVDEEYVELINRINADTPVVATGKLMGAQNLRVSLDEGGGMVLAMDYLFGLGHKRIALMGGRKDICSTLEKRICYRQMLRQKGIEYREEYVCESNDYANEGGYRCMKQLLELDEMPTAIIGINDHTASGLIRAAYEAGLKIPEDVSVIGFDNTYLAEAVTPKLTSIGCDYCAFAENLVGAAVNASNGKVSSEDVVIPVRLTIRDSCRKI